MQEQPLPTAAKLLRTMQPPAPEGQTFYCEGTGQHHYAMIRSAACIGTCAQEDPFFRPGHPFACESRGVLPSAVSRWDAPWAVDAGVELGRSTVNLCHWKPAMTDV